MWDTIMQIERYITAHSVGSLSGGGWEAGRWFSNCIVRQIAQAEEPGQNPAT